MNRFTFYTEKWLDKGFRYIPNSVFITLANTLGNNTAITTNGDHYSITRDGITLESPTPKYIGFGLSTFARRFERYFAIEPGDVCVDIGACIGDTAIPMHMKSGSTGKVFAVEPVPSNAHYLRLNCPWAEVVEKAVWSEPTTLEFNVNEANITGGSILHKSDSIIRIEADTLDHMFEHITDDFAKIDVQLAEAEVLRGADAFLQRTKKLCVVIHERYSSRSTFTPCFEILKHHYPNIAFAMDTGVLHCWK